MSYQNPTYCQNLSVAFSHNTFFGETQKNENSRNLRLDYYPFGSPMPSRTFTGNGYRFGFNGQEKENEIYGEGNTYSAEYWMYDSRLGRRWNLDPKYLASESRYVVFSNNPIIYTDPLGDFRTKFGARLYKWTHGGVIGQDKGSGQWFVGKQVEYTGEGVGAAYQKRFDWNGGNQPYTGSGWGHTERSVLANILGVNGKVKDLTDLVMNSVLQNSSVQLTGEMLDLVKQDPDIIRYENWIVEQLQGKGEGTYNFTRDRKSVV